MVEKKRREIEMRVKITSAEKEAYTAAASQDGLSLSAWIRSVANRWLRREKREEAGK